MHVMGRIADDGDCHGFEIAMAGEGRDHARFWFRAMAAIEAADKVEMRRGAEARHRIPGRFLAIHRRHAEGEARPLQAGEEWREVENRDRGFALPRQEKRAHPGIKRFGLGGAAP